VPDVVTREELLSRHAATLLRLAHQLVGDPGGAIDVVLGAAARLPRHGRPEQLGQRTIRQVLPRARSALGHRPNRRHPDTALDLLPSTTRSCAVLAFALDWDPQTIADACRTTPHRVQAHVVTALHVQPESAWRALLAEPSWDVPVPADLVVSVHRIRRRRQSRRHQLAVGVGCVAITLAGVATAATRILTAPGPLPPAAHATGLLSWSPRGSLIRNGALIDRAAAVWTRHGPTHGSAHPLWAGEVGRGRLVVLQAQSPTGTLVAVVGDESDRNKVPRLTVQSVRALTDTNTPMIAVPYGGNLGLLGLEGGAGAAIVQMLTAPGLDKVVERHFAGSSDRRAPYVVHAVSGGMSTPWVDVALGGGVPSTAVSAYRRGHLVYRGILDRRLELARVQGHVRGPTAKWAGLPTSGTDAAGIADDYLWWAQTCHGKMPVVRIVWTGRAPGSVTPLRLETYRCGGPGRAVFLTGYFEGVRIFDVARLGKPFYLTQLVPTGGGPMSFVLVGSRDVAAFRVGGERRPGRVAVVPFRDAGRVEALDRHGHKVTY
jgi:hypothetical protein